MLDFLIKAHPCFIPVQWLLIFWIGADMISIIKNLYFIIRNQHLSFMNISFTVFFLKLENSWSELNDIRLFHSVSFAKFSQRYHKDSMLNYQYCRWLVLMYVCAEKSCRSCRINLNGKSSHSFAPISKFKDSCPLSNFA